MSYEETLTRLHLTGNFRSIPSPSSDREGTLDLSGNDYLGLASRTDLRDEFLASIAENPPAFSMSASRLLAADQSTHFQLEQRLQQLYGGRPALIFNSGYHANTGLISALASEQSTLIIADRLVHASIIDGIILSRAPFKRFPHNDFDRLEIILRKEAPNFRRIIVAVESVYSMDGDQTNLQTLIELKQRFGNIILYVDEAHAFGVNGRNGLGLAASLPEFNEIDIVVGTFGKAAASVGAFSILSPTLRDYIVNRARSFIFSTALPPFNCAWTDFIVAKLPTMENERLRLRQIEQLLFDAINALPGATLAAAPSHIVPYIVGDARQTLDLSAQLLERGYKVLPIRTPTVPPGTERLRISLNAAIEPKQIQDFAKTLSELCKSN